MLGYLARYWWVITVRGGLAIVFGVMIMAWPAVTLLALAIVFGLYALADGIVAAVGAVRAPPDARLALVAEAFVGIVFGIVSLLWPGVTVLVITILVGFWAIITGVGEISTAIRLRKEIHGEWMYVLFGVFSILFGLIVLTWPVRGALAVAWLIGVCAVVYGIFLVATGFRLRFLTGEPPAPRGAPPTAGPAA